MELTKEDYIIICGDFGLCWAKDKTFEYHCKNFAEKPYTILWVQGNHENYDMIGEYPLEEWHGGKARHIIRDKSQVQICVYIHLPAMLVRLCCLYLQEI